MAKKTLKSSLTTRTGKTLLGPLNVRQLEERLEKASRPKEKAKIQRRLTTLLKRPENQQKTVLAVDGHGDVHEVEPAVAE